jgi:hypothetical protein
MKYINLRNEEKKTKPSTPMYLTKDQIINNQINISKENNSTL